MEGSSDTFNLLYTWARATRNQKLTDWHLWGDSLDRTSIAIGAALVTLVVLFTLRYFPRNPVNSLPTYHVLNNVWDAIKNGHIKYPDDPFVLSLVGMKMVILPHSCIDLIKSLPENHVSIKKHHYDVFLGQYTYMGAKADEFDEAMRHDLPRNTPKLLASFVSEVEYAMTATFGHPQQWTPFQPRAIMSQIASLMSGRAFVGLPLSRDNEWATATVSYTQNVTKAWMILRIIPPFLRGPLGPFLPQVKKLLDQKTMTKQKLQPLLTAHGLVDDGVPGGEMMAWFRGRYKTKEPTAEELTRDQLLVTFASIYNLSNALSYLLFDIATYPEHISILRAELDEQVGPGNIINKENIQRLVKLDSFIRESQRLSPPSLANMPRIVTHKHGLRLPSGQTIPQGTRIMIRAHTLNMSTNLWDDPEQFDGFRFSRLRAKPGNERKYQHATTGTDNINFGHGIWACPGRHFASAQMKVVLAYLLLNYDIKLENEEKLPRQQHLGLAIVPDTEAKVLLRLREDKTSLGS